MANGLSVSHDENPEGLDVAVIGFDGRFPGAEDAQHFWNNLQEGVESVTSYTDEELLERGVTAQELATPGYIKMGAPLDQMECFDAGFFGFSPRDASIMDPQHRHFLEVAWSTLEHAGYDPSTYEGSIGVYAGSGMNAYMPYNLLTNPALVDSVGFFLLRHTGNDKDFLTTRVSYCFNLTGPSVNIQTACSTSLVAIHAACQSLAGGECDMALAGGVTIELPHRRGYLYEEGEILSPDGHCRAFDAQSKGTIFGSGVGAVLLKRLADAEEDGDTIHAIVKASAINNDGASKVGYLAPSVDGQVGAITEALALADISPTDISYVETHGTGTPVGDPIEVAALTKAFGQDAPRGDHCGIGSVKTNIGHLDTAAGVAGFIKVVQALKHQKIPPSLHFKSPNPTIDFENSPFYVNAKLQDWTPRNGPRRALVNSLGVGGTNALVVLEEAPTPPTSEAARAQEVIVLSAKSARALDGATDRLARFLESNPNTHLGDLAYTLQVGRRHFLHRKGVVVSSVSEAKAALLGEVREHTRVQKASDTPRRPVFCFPGGGAQYPNMGKVLYESFPLFKEEMDRCLQAVQQREQIDLLPLLFPPAEAEQQARQELKKPSLALPALFSTSYALAKLWMSVGVKPESMIGHSMGEYVAACLAGVFSLEDALSVVTLRGRLFESLPKGGMLAVHLSAQDLEPHLTKGLSIAARNGPELVVASGPVDELEQLQNALEAQEIDCRSIPISVAAHSSMLEPILEPFLEALSKLNYQEPSIPFVSNVTGTWIQPGEATQPEYWVKHLRASVLFAEGLTELLKDDGRYYLEVGPGRTLTTFVQAHPDWTRARPVFTSLRHPKESVSDLVFFLDMLARMHVAGIPLEWRSLHPKGRRRLPLPTYPFEHTRYWVEPGQAAFKDHAKHAGLERKANLKDWFYLPVWKPEPLQTPNGSLEAQRILALGPESGPLSQLEAALKKRGHTVIRVTPGAKFEANGQDEFKIRPGAQEDYEAVLATLQKNHSFPQRIVHAHAWDEPTGRAPGHAFESEGPGLECFYSLLYLLKALSHHEEEDVCLSVLSSNMQTTRGEATEHPTKALLLGPTLVANSELPKLRAASIDVAPEPHNVWSENHLTEQLEREVLSELKDPVVAYRGPLRLCRSLEPTPIGPCESPGLLKKNGVYIITGGLGGLGLELATHLAKRVQARLVLLGRRGLPEEPVWDTWVSDHDPSDTTSRKIHKVRMLRSLGAEVLTFAKDVTKPKDVRDVVENTKRQFGTIDGVFHTAGVIDDGLIPLKTQQSAGAVLAPKVQGTMVLAEALEGEKLDFLLLFSSISSMTGLAGQADYAAANAFLDAFAHHRTTTRGQTTIAVDWGVWRDVGMAASIGRTLGITATGAVPEGERCHHPLWDTSRTEDNRTQIFEALLSAEKHWILGEHRLKSGDAVLPGTGYLELVRGARQPSNPAEPFIMKEISFMTPFTVAREEEKLLRLRVYDKGDTQNFVFESGSGPDEQVHATGTIVRASEEPAAPEHPDWASLESRCPTITEQPAGTGTEQHIDFGPRWKNLVRVGFGDNEARAELKLADEFKDEITDFHLHPALLDFATAAGQPLIPGFDPQKDFFVPMGYKAFCLLRPLPGHLVSHIRRQAAPDPNTESFDITLFDTGGQALAHIQGFMIRRLSGAFAATPAARAPKRAAANPVLELGLRDGISCKEGMEVLDRILGHQILPQVAISTQDFGALLTEYQKQGETEDASEESPGIELSRPNLATEYVAPRSDTEKMVAAVWQNVLGIAQVGVDDDFFELGGHSLLLTQVVSRVRKKADLDIPMRKLFENRTVASLSGVIEATRGDEKQSSGPKLKRVVRDAYRKKRSALQPRG